MNLSRQSFIIISFCMCFTSACKTVSYFHTPNDMLRQAGTVYLQNGNEKKGEITITFETGYAIKSYITVTSNGHAEKVFLRDVKGYKIKDKYYAPMYIDLEGNGINNLLFVRQVTGDNSKINLYELYRLNQGASANGEDPYSYYLSLPTFPKYEVWNVSSKHLVPRFDEKMSKIVESCPALAEKIQRQDKGYFYPQISLSNQKKAAILKTIIDEYNECK